jgi:hypothetical protein
MTNRFRVCCATVTPSGKPEQREIKEFLLRVKLPMKMNQQQWHEWFQKFRSRCKKFEQENLDASIELKIAVKANDYDGAEKIAMEIIGGKTRQEQEVNRILNKILD